MASKKTVLRNLKTAGKRLVWYLLVLVPLTPWLFLVMTVVLPLLITWGVTMGLAYFICLILWFVPFYITTEYVGRYVSKKYPFDWTDIK
jgi:hypothetical protein